MTDFPELITESTTSTELLWAKTLVVVLVCVDHIVLDLKLNIVDEVYVTVEEKISFSHGPNQ